MKSYLYYLKYNGKYLNWSDSSYASAESNNRPLIVNCASCVNTPEQHKNANVDGRLDYTLIYVIEGTLTSNSPSGSKIIEGGNVLIIPPKTPYEFDCSGEVIYFLTVHFTGSEVVSKLQEYGISFSPQ